MIINFSQYNYWRVALLCLLLFNGGVIKHNAQAASLAQTIPVVLESTTISVDKLVNANGAQYNPDPTTSSVVQLDASLFEQTSFILHLNANNSMIAIRDKVINKPNHKAWLGHIENNPLSEITLTQSNNTIAGRINYAGNQYTLTYVNDDRYLLQIARMNDTDNIMLADDVNVDSTAPTIQSLMANPAVMRPATASLEAVQATTNTNVDVLVLYTPAAITIKGSKNALEAAIRANFDYTNQAFANSQAKVQLNIVALQQVAYTETGDAQKALAALISSNDGILDQVHSLRNQWGADLVVLITSDPHCGTTRVGTSGGDLGKGGTLRSDLGFVVASASCLGNHALAHEIGHNFGANHDHETHAIEYPDGSNHYFNYSFGYRQCKTPPYFMTIMSYDCSWNNLYPNIHAEVIPYFSNPNLAWRSQPIGIAETANPANASEVWRAINTTKEQVAAFRQAPTVIKPIAPMQLTSSNLMATQVKLAWLDKANNEDTYYVERSESSQTNWKVIAELAANSVTYMDQGLKPLTTYYYRVNAGNRAGVSAYSNVLTIKTPTLISLQITKDGTGSGVVSSQLTTGGINCGKDCSEIYGQTTSVVITAKADAGSTFAGWKGACIGTTATCTVKVNSVNQVTATFNKVLIPILTSSAFSANGYIPKLYTCDGSNISPPLAWSNIPSSAKSLALIVDDPDAPAGTWVHWVVYNLPVTSTGLAAGATLPASTKQGMNSFGKAAYGGPCPPSGQDHRYVHKLYALDSTLANLNKPTSAQLVAAMQGHIVGQASLIGRYKH